MPVWIKATTVRRDVQSGYVSSAVPCRLDVTMNEDGTLSLGIGDREYRVDAETLIHAITGAKVLRAQSESMANE